MFSWALAARAATVCVGTQPECVDSLQAALDDPANDTIEIFGTHTGPFHVAHDVTLIGQDDDAVLRLTGGSPGGTVLGATGALTIRTLTLDANNLAQNLRVTGGSVVLDRATLSDGLAPLGSNGCVAIEATDLTVTDTLFSGCRHFGTEAGLWASADTVTMTDSTFRGNDGPALEVVGAASATLDGLVVRANGVDFRGQVGGVHLVDVGALSLTRSSFCDNVGRRGGGLTVERGCTTGDCRVEHVVFQSNRARVGGGLVWGGETGVVAHSTFVGNGASAAGLAVGIAAGHVDLVSTLFVESPPDVATSPSASDPPTTIETRLEATVTLTGSALHVLRPGLPIDGDNLDLPSPPVFFDGYVAPACGPSVTVDPLVPENAPFAAWPDEASIGALTTDDCGPWCDDLDADGVPAMWDCDAEDPTRGLGLEELGDDGIDQDCDGFDVCFEDPDGDGFGSAPLAIDVGADCPGDVRVGNDCNEDDPAVHPGAAEIPGDGTDSDCDTRELCFADADGDGVTGDNLIPADLSCTEGWVGSVDQGDCDDTDPERRGTYCGVRVVGGCSTTAFSTTGWLAALGLLGFAPRRR